MTLPGRLMVAAHAALLGEEATLQLARVTGSTMARLAEDCGFSAQFRLYGRIPLNDYMYVNLRPV